MRLAITIGIVTIALLSVVITPVLADRNNNQHDGNNGQCRQVQKILPPELRDYEGCHDSFSGQDHNDNNGDNNNGIGHGNGEENGNGHDDEDPDPDPDPDPELPP